MSKATPLGTVDYAALAQLHRPTDHDCLVAEVRRLAREQNLSARDISVALRISLATIHEWLAGVDHAG